MFYFSSGTCLQMECFPRIRPETHKTRNATERKQKIHSWPLHCFNPCDMNSLRSFGHTAESESRELELPSTLVLFIMVHAGAFRKSDMTQEDQFSSRWRAIWSINKPNGGPASFTLHFNQPLESDVEIRGVFDSCDFAAHHFSVSRWHEKSSVLLEWSEQLSENCRRD